MTRKYKSIEEIPTEYFSVWEAAVEAGDEGLELDLGDSDKALAMRQMLYVIRRQLLDAKHPGSLVWSRFEIKQKGPKLRIQLPEWMIRTRKALERVRGPEPTPENELPTVVELPPQHLEPPSVGIDPAETSHMSSAIRELYSGSKVLPILKKAANASQANEDKNKG